MIGAKKPPEPLKSLAYLLGDARTALELALVKGRPDQAARWLETLEEDARRARELLGMSPLPSLGEREREFAGRALDAVGEIDAALASLVLYGSAEAAGSWLADAERSIRDARGILSRILEREGGGGR